VQSAIQTTTDAGDEAEAWVAQRLTAAGAGEIIPGAPENVAGDFVDATGRDVRIDMYLSRLNVIAEVKSGSQGLTESNSEQIQQLKFVVDSGQAGDNVDVWYIATRSSSSDTIGLTHSYQNAIKAAGFKYMELDRIIG